VGWLPLGASLLAALADTSNTAIAIPLVAAGVVAVSGLALAVKGIASERSSLTAVTSGLALVLNVALLTAATFWAASVHWK
jgi:hypothetical protein